MKEELPTANGATFILEYPHSNTWGFARMCAVRDTNGVVLAQFVVDPSHSVRRIRETAVLLVKVAVPVTAEIKLVTKRVKTVTEVKQYDYNTGGYVTTEHHRADAGRR